MEFTQEDERKQNKKTIVDNEGEEENNGSESEEGWNESSFTFFEDKAGETINENKQTENNDANEFEKQEDFIRISPEKSEDKKKIISKRQPNVQVNRDALRKSGKKGLGEKMQKYLQIRGEFSKREVHTVN
jgi:hypothetical protein